MKKASLKFEVSSHTNHSGPHLTWVKIVALKTNSSRYESLALDTRNQVVHSNEVHAAECSGLLLALLTVKCKDKLFEARNNRKDTESVSRILAWQAAATIKV